MMKNRTLRPAKIVTDTSLPTAYVSTSVTRAVYDELGRVALSRGLTKSSLLREMILEEVSRSDRSEP